MKHSNERLLKWYSEVLVVWSFSEIPLSGESLLDRVWVWGTVELEKYNQCNENMISISIRQELHSKPQCRCCLRCNYYTSIYPMHAFWQAESKNNRGRAEWNEFTMFWNRAIESTSKLCPVCEECRAVERWPFEELRLLNNNYRRTLAAPSVLFHTYMTAVQTAQLHIPHTLSFTLLSLYSNALIDTYMHVRQRPERVQAWKQQV